MNASSRTSGEPLAAAGSSTWRRWRAVIWDDALNSREYVTAALARHLRVDADVASAIVAEARRSGVAVVATGDREAMEAEVLALASYGLRATLEEV